MGNTDGGSRGKVLGVGGVFFRCVDTEKTVAWYRDVLGMDPNDYNGFDFLHRESAARFPEAARTIFAPFADDSEYFKPSTLPFMFNLVVDDLDAIIVRAEAAGAVFLQARENTDYGDFAWLLDPDGRKVELWEPKEPALS
jgi:predicted enzyme related to lactoylglutathione lyase